MKNLNLSGKCLFLILIIAFAVNLNFAQDDNFIKGTEKPLYTESKDSNDCLVFEKFVVKNEVLKEGKNDFNKIQAFTRNAALSPKENCQDSGNSIFSYTRKEEINSVENSLLGNWLFVNLSITPDSEILLIFDLISKKKIFEKEHTEWGKGMQISKGKYLLYDEWTKQKGLAKNCPNAKKWKKEGLGVDWLKPFRLDLQTMKATPFGELQCVSTY
ncbi:MAG TPA: hypothetical protein PKY82_30995 [Pyrinomonadaceae bacterium]|nr:hypothetical protein [Pyrinomonadaceae bacterium]